MLTHFVKRVDYHALSWDEILFEVYIKSSVYLVRRISSFSSSTSRVHFIVKAENIATCERVEEVLTSGSNLLGI